MIYERADNFHSLEEAWTALDSDQADTYDPVPFNQWVKEQYWTAEEVKVEAFVF